MISLSVGIFFVVTLSLSLLIPTQWVKTTHIEKKRVRQRNEIFVKIDHVPDCRTVASWTIARERRNPLLSSNTVEQGEFGC